MARLQILELPEGTSDDRPPFVLVVDESVPQRIVLGVDHPVRDYWQDIADKIGARAVIVTPETIDIPANDTSAYALGGPLPASPKGPDFTSSLAGRIEVRKPCPYCGDQQMIPAHQFREHMARLHPDEPATDA
ncbi:hypothetical protein C9F11_38380 [Streptomyces sp. YIM 121038]|uniref:hypothetical protein n=1 Tax=Streptomyces sp. YIM 121038 TaxID=2136401 RepID=UPI001161E96E|nr:hypothetical protein [Streptomyces sp. YIM 121038]QCX81259.1 hypothetical protein C9F11_38380 [Streptomyces sp. YIM 121038]